MRPPAALLTVLFLSACGRDSLTVHGTLLPGSDATDVYVVGRPLRGRVVADSFTIAGIRGEVVELEFAEGNDRLGRMRIERWNADELVLRGIWMDDGVAHATALRGEAAADVNGLRMAGAGALPLTIEADGVVLAASGRGDALILRPVGSGLPDLRVVLTPGTAIEREGGGPPRDELRFGDSVRVEGTAEAGYVVATRLVVRARPAAEEMAPLQEWEVLGTEVHRDDDGMGGDADRDRDQEKVEEEEEERRGAGSLVRPGGGRGRGRGLQPRDD